MQRPGYLAGIRLPSPRLGQADWFYGGKQAAEFNPCPPGHEKEEWGGGIRCIDPAMKAKYPALQPASLEPASPAEAPLPSEVPRQTANAGPSLEEEYDMEKIIPFAMGAGIVLLLILILIIKLIKK